VIAGRLAISQRIGGHGIQHRRIRREEEILWLKNEAGVNTIVSLLEGNQNVSAYEDAAITVVNEPLLQDYDVNGDIERVLECLHRALSDPKATVLLHRDTVDDTLAGILAAYLIHSRMLNDPIKASVVIQEILGRPLGPRARAMVSAAQAD
jgi:hypothetical protein